MLLVISLVARLSCYNNRRDLQLPEFSQSPPSAYPPSYRAALRVSQAADDTERLILTVRSRDTLLPVSDASITLTGAGAQEHFMTDGYGACRLVAPDGVDRIAVSHADYFPEAIDANNLKGQTHYELLLRRQGRLDLTILDGDDMPISDVYVVVHPWDNVRDTLSAEPYGWPVQVPDRLSFSRVAQGGRDAQNTRTNSAGHVEIRGLPCEDSLAIMTYFAASEEATILTIPSEQGARVATLRRQRTVGISGSVLWSDGNPAPGIDIALEPTGRFVHPLRTDINGEYRCAFVRPEPLTLIPLQSPTHAVLVERPGRDPIPNIVLDRPTRIDGQITGFDITDMPSVDCYVVATSLISGERHSFRMVSNGQFHADVRRGPHRLELDIEDADSRTWVAASEIVDAPASGVVLDASRGSSLVQMSLPASEGAWGVWLQTDCEEYRRSDPAYHFRIEGSQDPNRLLCPPGDWMVIAAAETKGKHGSFVTGVKLSPGDYKNLGPLDVGVGQITLGVGAEGIRVASPVHGEAVFRVDSSNRKVASVLPGPWYVSGSQLWQGSQLIRRDVFPGTALALSEGYSPCQSTLRVTVLEEGRGVEGAQVALYSEERDRALCGTSSSALEKTTCEGAAVFTELCPGPYRIRVATPLVPNSSEEVAVFEIDKRESSVEIAIPSSTCLVEFLDHGSRLRGLDYVYAMTYNSSNHRGWRCPPVGDGTWAVPQYNGEVLFLLTSGQLRSMYQADNGYLFVSVPLLSPGVNQASLGNGVLRISGKQQAFPVAYMEEVSGIPCAWLTGPAEMLGRFEEGATKVFRSLPESLCRLRVRSGETEEDLVISLPTTQELHVR